VTICIIIMVAVVGMLLVVTTFDLMHNSAMDHAGNTIDNMQNTSDDYRQGWNDCLADIDDHYNKAQNMTSDTADKCV